MPRTDDRGDDDRTNDVRTGISAIAKAGPWRSHPRVAKLITLMDDGFRVPGTEFRIGLDPILGLLLPEVGDVLSGLLSATLLFSAWRAKLPTAALARMVFNIGVDAIVGAVPILGDAFDFFFKANRKNAEILAAYHEHPGTKPTLFDHVLLASGVLFAIAIALVPMVITFFAARFVFEKLF